MSLQKDIRENLVNVNCFKTVLLVAVMRTKEIGEVKIGLLR